MNKTEYWGHITDQEQQNLRNKADSDLLAYLLHGTVPKGMVEVGWKHNGKGFAGCLVSKTDN